MAIQIAVWVADTDKTAALVELVQLSGGVAIPLDTLQPGEQRQFPTFPGCAIRVTEVTPSQETPKS
jgi:hypothetical protein